MLRFPFVGRSSFVAALVAALPFVRPAAAQCATNWTADFTYPAMAPVFWAMTQWDRDGGGPEPARVAIGIQGLAAERLLSRDPSTGDWVGIPGTETANIYALQGLPNGDLVVAGASLWPGGLPFGGIARWDGAAWHTLRDGGSSYSLTHSLALDASGALLASFRSSPTSASQIERWNGSSWSPLGGSILGSVADIAVLPNGDVVAAGFFGSINGVTVGNIARWNGSSWGPMGSGTNSEVLGLCVLANGDLLAGGSFSHMNGVVVNGIARWNGSVWSPMGSGVGNTVAAITQLANGEVVIGGAFVQTVAGLTVNRVARWDGAAWSPLGSGVDSGVTALTALPTGGFVAGGWFGTAGGNPATVIAQWNGATWQALPFAPLAFGPNSSVRAFAPLPNGDVVAVGSFDRAGTWATNGVGRWDGSSWAPFGAGPGLGYRRAVTTLPNGDIVVGGIFEFVGSMLAEKIVRWNGSAWSSIGSVGVGGYVHALTTRANGDLVVGGAFTGVGDPSNPTDVNHVAAWNGTSWSSLGSGLTGNGVFALATMPDGDLVVGGMFTHADGLPAANIARWSWSTSSWSALGSGTNGAVYALHVATDGSLFAGGLFTTAGGGVTNRLARWDGTAWSAVGSGVTGSVHAITQLADGDLVIGGGFAAVDGVPANNLARWNGTSWSAMEGGTNGLVLALLARGNGELLIGGGFDHVAGNASFYMARRVTTCPATATAFGAGCSSGSGTLTLTSTRPPWLGAFHSAQATGFGPSSLGIAMMGFTAIAPGLLPLATLPVPGGGAGCDLLQSLDIQTGLVLPVGGQGSWSAWMPDEPSLAGGTFQLQFGELEFGPDWIGTYSTNALTCTIGSL